MSKTIVVCGHGPGISDAVAKKFGSEGFAVALVARSADKLTKATAALEAQGVRAAAYPTDLGDPAAVSAMIGRVRGDLGPITVVHWNAYAMTAGDLTTASAADLRVALDVSATGLVAAVQAALPDLRREQGAAVLVTGGGLSKDDPRVDALAVSWNVMGLAVAKAAQHKLVGLLAEKLRGDRIYVGEVVVLGSVKGTPFDTGAATLEASAIAGRFWDLYVQRTPTSVTIA
jgi:NADP-dependent 3-hydroxy acid dehydrogenase YdfG